MHIAAIAAVKVAESRSRSISRARRARLIAARRFSTFRQRANFIWELKTFVRESLMAVLLSLVIVTLAGVLFGSLREALMALPGLMLLVPGALAMRGNIFASLGARLGTALHTGELSSKDPASDWLREEYMATMVQTLAGSLFLAIAGRLIAFFLHIPTVSWVSLAVTAALGALAAGVVVLVVTVKVAITAHYKGWDPDNVTAPVISSVADLVSIPALLGAAFLVVAMPTWLINVVLVALVLVTVGMVGIIGRKGMVRAAEILTISTPVLLVVLVIIIAPALLLEGIVDELVETPAMLVILPPFLAIAGNLGAILASRLSSAAHLGLITMKGPPDAFVYQNLGVILVLALLTFGALGGLVEIIGSIMGIASPGLVHLMIISLGGGLVLTGAVCLAAIQVTAYTFRHGDDPDNVVIPVITSTMDALGTGLVVVLFVLLVT